MLARISRAIFAVILAMSFAASGYIAFSDADAVRHYQGQLDTPDQVYDGDTLSDVQVKIADFHERGEVWPGIFLTDEGVFSTFNLRLAHIDTPERRPRKTWPDGTPRSEASRQREKDLAMQARALLTHLLLDAGGGQFIVTRPTLGKYAGRVVCEVWIEHPEQPGKLLSVAQVLLDAKLAKPYEGGTRPRWD